ncbi:hypothetical protein ABEB36_004422 [Hypothenemus hampei]
MGPSGAGKTSLLNILTGYQKTGVQGVIRCKHDSLVKFGVNYYQNKSCYILQDDYLISYFTVEEIMYSTTKLKIHGLPLDKMKCLIDDILNTLGLNTLKKTFCGNLSGGQKKRLCIALELIDDPPILFLDEPTTGLDSNSSNQCIQMLKGLAERGRTIICTVHQPSGPLYNTFNHIYFMAKGKCIYKGAPENTILYLANQGFACPKYHNPADFLMEISSDEYGDYVDDIAETVNKFDWRYPINLEDGKFNEKSVFKRKDTLYYLHSFNKSYKKPNEWIRFQILFKKQVIYYYRDWTISKLKLLIHFLVGIFLGVTFRNSGIDASKSIQNCSLFLVSIVYLCYTSIMPACLRFPGEMKIIKKEYFNRWYKLPTFYMAYLAADIPIQILFAFSYSVGSYVISSQPMEFHRFFMVLLILSLVSLVSAGIGVMYGALNENPVSGTFFGSITTAVLLLFAGILCMFPDMSKILYFFTNLSFLSFSMEGLLQAIYGYDRETLVCPEYQEYCMYTNPKELLADIGMDKLSYWVDIAWITVNLIIFRVLAYCSLKFKVNSL